MESERQKSPGSQTVTKVETVEVDLHECPLCEQQYEEEEMAEIKIDKRKLPIETKRKARFHGSGQLCTYCANSVFGYDRPATSYGWTHTPDGDEDSAVGEGGSWSEIAVNLYKCAFIFATGGIVGWLASNQATIDVAASAPVIEPPAWLTFALVPGIVWLILTVLPTPGAGGLSG